MVHRIVLFSSSFILFQIASSLYNPQVCENGDQNNNYEGEMKQGKYDVMQQVPS